MRTEQEAISGTQLRSLLSGLFEHQTLLLAGLTTSECVPDRFVWRLARVLEASRQRIVRNLEGMHSRESGNRPRTADVHLHPAFQEFLRRLQTDHELRTSQCGSMPDH